MDEAASNTCDMEKASSGTEILDEEMLDCCRKHEISHEGDKFVDKQVIGWCCCMYEVFCLDLER